MSSLSDEYRRQAAYCEEMAETATSPDARADWLRLAGKWLAMLPQKDEASRDRFDAMVHNKGTRQKDSKSAH